MTPLKRLPGWRTRLKDFTEEVRRREFAWGDHDCGPAFTGRAVQVMTGADLAKGFRRYRTAKGALAAMQKAGFNNLGDLVACMLPEIHPSLAGVGDIAAFETDSAFGYALGIVNGERVLVLTETGMGTRELLDAKRAYKVG